MKNKTMTLGMELAPLLALASVAQAAVINVPNGGFEEIYKPGSTIITADIGDGQWTNGVGLSAPMQNGQLATYSDATTGSSVDIPGWINAPGWPISYDWPQGSGVISRQAVTPDGLYSFAANGSSWGNPKGGALESAAPLALIDAGMSYTVSMIANGPVSNVFIQLLANGVPLTPSSSITPTEPHAWDVVSSTYDAASLAGHIGEELTIRAGWGDGVIDVTGGQSQLDMVTLTSVPEPSSIALLACGAFGLALRRRR